MHVIAAKAVCFKEAATPEFQAYARQVTKKPQVMAKELSLQRLRARDGRDGQTSPSWSI
jgi:glycine hydroxymethyltransferase